MDVLSEGSQACIGLSKGDQITLDVVGLGNDVDVDITGAVTGESRFHVRASLVVFSAAETLGRS